MLGDQAALRLADAQLGLLTRAQALSSGLTDDQVKRRIGMGSLIAVHRGVYRLPGSEASFAQRALAGCLACGGGAVVSHRTAAALFHLIDPPPGLIEITTPSSHFRRPSGIVVPRSRVLDRVVVGAVPSTSVSRTLLDVAGVLEPDELESAMDEALRRGVLTPARLLRYVDRGAFTRSRGIGRLRRLARDRIAGVPESELETRALRLIRTYGLPKPVRQFEIRAAGRVVRFDLAYLDRRVAIELDGRAPHWGRHRWQSDHDRHNATEMAGWRILRFTWWDVTERPLHVAVSIAAGLGLRPARWTTIAQNRSPSRGRTGVGG